MGGLLGEDTGTTSSSPPHHLSSTSAGPWTDQTTGEAGSRNRDGGDSRPSPVPASACSPHLSAYPASVRPLRTPLEHFPL